MSLKQTTLAQINKLLRRDLPMDFMGSVHVHLDRDPHKCRVDIKHCIKLDPAHTTLSLIDRGQKTAVK